VTASCPKTKGQSRNRKTTEIPISHRNDYQLRTALAADDRGSSSHRRAGGVPGSTSTAILASGAPP